MSIIHTRERGFLIAKLFCAILVTGSFSPSEAADSDPTASYLGLIDVAKRRELLSADRSSPIWKSIRDLPSDFEWPDPVAKSFNIPPRYLGGNQSVIDPRYVELRKPFDDMMFGLSVLTERYIALGYDDDGQEIINRLHEWATAESATTTTTSQGQFSQIFYGHTFSIFLDVVNQEGRLVRKDYDLSEANLKKLDDIREWLLKMQTDNVNRLNLTNNIGQWQGLTSLLNAKPGVSQAIINNGITNYNRFISHIGTDNSISPENGRAELALWYNQYALIPAMLSAELLARNAQFGYEGNPYFAENKYGMGLHDATGFLMDALDTPSLVARLTSGSKFLQEIDDERKAGGPSSWLEVYNGRFPTPRAEDLLIDEGYSPYTHGGLNLALTLGSLATDRNQFDLRPAPPNTVDFNIYSLVVKKGVVGKTDINPEFSFGRNKPTDSDVQTGKIGAFAGEGHSLMERGLDYLVIDKRTDPDEDFFADGLLSVRQFIGIGMDNNITTPTETSGGVGIVMLHDGQQVETWNTLLGYGFGTKGVLTVAGEAAEWTSLGDFKVGAAGTGQLAIQASGYVESVDGYTGFGPTGVGDVTIEGPGSRWNNLRSLTIGQFGSGSVRVSEGALLTAGSDRWGVRIAPFPSSVGVLTIGGEVGADGLAGDAVVPGLIDAPFVQMGARTAEAKALSFGEGAASVNFNHTTDDYIFAPKLVGTGMVNLYSGTTTLAGENDFGGALNLYGGTLLVSSSQQLADVDASITIDGGTLDIAGLIDLGQTVSLKGRAGMTVQQGYGLVLSGPITGAGAITKAGPGSLAVIGDGSIFSGTTEVVGGELVVGIGGKGSLGGDLSILDGARLSGTGIVGNITIAEGGTHAPGNSIGVQTVQGDYVNHSILEIEATPEAADQIKVSGSVNITGATLSLLLSPDSVEGWSMFSGPFTIIDNSGTDAVVGQFGQVDHKLLFLTPHVGYAGGDGNDVTLALERNDITLASVAQTANQAAVARALDSAVPIETPIAADHTVLNTILLAEARQQDVVRANFDVLSGEIHASLKGALLQESRLIQAAINDRLRAAFDSVASDIVPVLAYGPNGPELSMPDTQRSAAWGTAFGSWGTLKGNGNAAALDTSTGGFLAGMDGLLGDDLRLGFMMGYSHSSFSLEQQSSSGTSDNYHLGLYGATQWGDLALRSGLTYTRHDIDTSRSVGGQILHGDYGADTVQLFGELGYRFDAPLVAFEPFAGLTYAKLDANGFTETGGSEALTASAGSTNVTATSLGLRAEADVAVGQINGTLRAMAGWQHALSDTTPLAHMNFAIGDGFTTAGVPLVKNAAIFEAGFDLNLAPTTTLGATYTGQLSSSGQNHDIKAKLAVRF